MNKAALVCRILLGLVFTIFGLNGFLHFIPNPPPEGVIGQMMDTYIKMGYMFPLIFGTQLVGGLLLLSGCFVALALVLLAPVIVNIVLVHIFLEPKGLPIALVVLALELFLAYVNRKKYAPLLKMK